MPPEPRNSVNLDAVARALARSHPSVARADRVVGLFDWSPFPRALERARRRLATTTDNRPSTVKASEWFLDNYYLLRRIGRQVSEDLPRGFLRRLPRLVSGPDAGLARIDAVARALVATECHLDATVLQDFINAYQEVSELTIAELWALPVMLRSALLRVMLGLLSELDLPARDSSAGPAPRESPAPTPGFDIGEAVGRCVRALRSLSEIDWKGLFAKLNRVDAILRRDPGHTYAKMDFDTCDAYRKVVEDLAWAAGRSEEDVAARAIALAEGAPPSDRGVGHYLLAEGRRTLEDEIGYRVVGVERLRRGVLAHPTFALLCSLALLTLGPLAALARQLIAHDVAWARVLATSVVMTLPMSVVAVVIAQRGFAQLLPAAFLPKLDFSKGIPDEARTLVVIPTVLGRADDVAEMVRQIELHYLSNPERGLQFALLTDDADSVTMPENASLIDSVTTAVLDLNAKHAKDGRSPFVLLHREPRWNAAEGRFMGWERKRGKLEELNRLLRGDTGTSYVRRVGDLRNLEDIRYVITLDSDTELPIGAAHRLVGLLAHPLNRATFDGTRVVSGYTIVQPRVETSPSSERQTWFSRIFAGDVGYDIYTRACSDLYQDLFGAGIYVGKGIYDVDAFMRSMSGRVPQNALASHDLFEGVHGRVALATDIALFEGYPSHYATYARRLQRWVRGDWQLAPWLLPWVPSASGSKLRNPLPAIDRWKIVDNLRRSLLAPSFLVLFASAWTWLPGSPAAWTLAAIGLLGAPLSPALVHRRRQALGRYALEVAFLAYEARLVVDAVARVAIRMVVTRRHLLEWTSTAHTAWSLARNSHRAFVWREMAWSPAISVALLGLLARYRPTSLAAAAPLLVLWLVAPEVAHWASTPRTPTGRQTVPPESRRGLRRIARRTWLFFETFVGPNDQWLPIDNHQERPHEQTAHRTSPTNIGMMLLSTISAYDLGYLGPNALALRLRRSFESIARLEHYQGHLLNWYDTRSLEPLLPRYVSTVDSGNLLGCLIVVEEACKTAAAADILRPVAWEGLLDALDLIEEVLETLPKASRSSVGAVMARVHEVAERAARGDAGVYDAIGEMSDGLHRDLRHELFSLVETGAFRTEPEALRALQRSIDGFSHQLQQTRWEMNSLLPWLSLGADAEALGLELPTEIRLDEVAQVADSVRIRIEARLREREADGGAPEALSMSARRLLDAADAARNHAEQLSKDLLVLASRASEEANGVDFRLLFDHERRLFHIGYNVTVDRLDANYYDLLASESRLASYLAIVRRDVPESHWFALGRPMTNALGSPALLSWGGTMFEYLMPALLMRSQEGTLLANSYERVVQAQISYGKKLDAPWGVSESGYARLDGHDTYQYRSFGVPGLGFKRGLEDDLVVAPYASFLALSIQPRAVVNNAAKLASIGMLGAYGLFEALDLRRECATARRPYAVVRSYMAHHQGMLLVAVNNALNADIMVRRFHADPMVRTGEMLLNERLPAVAPSEWPKVELHDASAAPATEAPAVRPWSPEPNEPEAFVLSNGALSTLTTAAGGGGLFWHGLALTRFEADPTRESDGLWIYVRDTIEERSWVTISGESRTTFAAHKADFHRREAGISTHVEITVAPGDDAEIRQVTVRNETERDADLTLTSFGLPSLVPSRDVSTHPAFANMFIESTWEEEIEGLVFSRRARSDDEERVVLAHRLVRDESEVRLLGYESDRAALLGRGAGAHVAEVVSSDEPLGRHTGAVIDPVMSLRAGVRLRPRETATFAFVTTVGASREAAIGLARRYGSMHAVRWAFRDAEPESRRRLQRAGVDPELLPAVQRLLSALLFVERGLRAPSEVIARGHPCKRELWGRGISGDEPIVLTVVHDVQAPLVREIIAAHEYLRSCGVRTDLVFVDEKASGYADDTLGALRNVVTQSGADHWLNHHGGIFIFATDQLPERDRLLLEASARVTLSTRDGSLLSRMKRGVAAAPRLPHFTPTHEPDASRPPMVLPELVCGSGFGGFSVDGREYVVAVRALLPTPAPWCNVLANAEFGCLVSESSLGCTWSLNSRENRLTPWRNDPVLDTPSEALYLRDEETAEIWSPSPSPAGKDCDTVVSHGAGYTKYTRESHGLVQELTVFVPADGPLKVLRLRLRDTSSRPRRLTATYYVEWVLGSQREEQRPYVVTELDRENACLLATCSWNVDFKERVAFVAASRDLHGFTADRREFLGRAGSYASPDALERWGLSGSTESGGDPCAALQVHIELAAGEELLTHFILGQASGRLEARQLVARYREPSAVEAAWIRLGEVWDDLLGHVRVKTPEPAMDLMLNRWLLYQTIAARFFGRTGFYQSSGAFGFRDQLQDTLAIMHSSPGLARAHILEAAAHQFEEGDVLHWWHPPAGAGVRTRCSDDMAWLPFVTAEYVSSTGDVSILTETAPFLAGPPLRKDEHDRYATYEHAEEGTLFDHCRRALHRALTRGPHGLPLMGDGDWNDGMNRVGSKGVGESVWLAWFLIATMDRFAALCEFTEAEAWRARADGLRRDVASSAWDGEWYVRAFHDDGSTLGSSRSLECRIDSIAQSWAVFAGGDRARAMRALASASDVLVNERDRLVLLLTPPFDTAAHDPGYIRAYPPGVRENGGQYTHAAAWLGWAYAALGDGDSAERLFRFLNPVLRTSTDEETLRYRIEPYVLAGDVYSAWPFVGRGGWSWYTGAAAWTWRLGVEAILGIHREAGTLCIDPCIPSAWRSFEAWITDGGEEFHVIVENPSGVSTGIASTTIDGVRAERPRLRVTGRGEGGHRTHEVRIRLGVRDAARPVQPEAGV
jgi:cyclic beta-1,2-glucan synthetase